MNWVDVAGPPGSGKSTLCYPIWSDRSVTWDGKPAPLHWKPYIDEIEALMHLVKDHPSFEAVVRMNERTLKKMATVERMEANDLCAAGSTSEIIWGKIEGGGVFFQSAHVQRILGFGWRLAQMGRDLNLIRSALWRVPVSIGVAFLDASADCLKARNRARRDSPATAHEDRSFQVDHMLPAIALAKEVLRARGVPVLEIDVEHQPIEAARAQLVAFSGQGPCDAAKMGHCG